jgi:hypothetical protein
MKKYAKIINEVIGTVSVGIGTDAEYYKSIGMELMDVEQGYDGQWYLAGKAPAPPAPTPEEIIKSYEDAVQAYLDQTAQSRDYDNTYTCLSYLSSTDEIWRRESNAFNAWRDSVWRKCHEILNAVKAGTIQPPTVAELIAQLPVIDWNDPKEE